MLKRHILFFLTFSLSACHPSARPSTGVVLTPKDLSRLTQPSPLARSPHSSRPKPLSPSSTRLPSLPKAFYQPVSLSITEQVPLQKALISLFQHSGLALQMDPAVDERVVFTAYHRPLIEVLEDLCDLAGLRYRVKGSSLRVEKDTPYAQSYAVQFLNTQRKNKNQISIATDVFSNGASKGVDNGSNSSIQISGEVDFWTELEKNLEMFLQEEGKEKGNFTLHRQGGMVTVRATHRQHKTIQAYLSALRASVLSQVLIEAKVVEVSLKEEYKSGINWQKLTKGDLRVNMPFGNLTEGGMQAGTNQPGNLLTFGFQGHGFSAVLKALEHFGASRTLSSPRLTVMNNQVAILKVAQNQVYFRLTYDKQLNLHGNRESINVSSQIQTVPIGLVMFVQPSIDTQTGEVVLYLRPTISRLAQSVRDPAVDIAFNANARDNQAVQPHPSLIPVVEVREIDSVLRIASQDEIAVLGGLIEIRSSRERNHVPGTAQEPFLRYVLGSQAEGEEVVELVILLKATILGDHTPLEEADRRLYHYVNDPRPFFTDF